MEPVTFDTLSVELSPALQALEAKRLALKKQGHRNGLWGGVIALLLGGVLTLCYQGGWIGCGIALALALGIYYFCIEAKSAALTAYYKHDIIAHMVCAFCDNARFTPESGIAESVFCSSDLFSRPDRYHTEDLLEGRIGSTDFCCAEVHAEERCTRTDGKGHTRYYWRDLFKGFIFVADFHKDFQGVTTVCRDSLIKLCFGKTRVRLENPDFEKVFDVYSSDQVEARYLLTPSMMERLLQVERSFGGGISLCFRNSKVLIAIPDSKNHFEASIWHSMADLNAVKAEFTTIRLLTGIVQELQLNMRIWSKE